MKKYLALTLLAMSALIVASCGNPGGAPGDQPNLPSQQEQGKSGQETSAPGGTPGEVPGEEADLLDGDSDAADSDTAEEEEVGVYPGMKAPELVLMDQDDNEIKLSDYKGKIVFLNFWATTCPYCVAEMPDLEKFQQTHKDDPDFALIGVNMTKTWEKKPKDKINEWVQEQGITFPNIYDVDGVEAERWMAHSLPVTYVIDPDGNSLGALMGKTPLDTFEAVLKEVRKNQ